MLIEYKDQSSEKQDPWAIDKYFIKAIKEIKYQVPKIGSYTFLVKEDVEDSSEV